MLYKLEGAPPQRGHRAHGSFQLQQPLLPGHLLGVSLGIHGHGQSWLTHIKAPGWVQVGVGMLGGQWAGGQGLEKCGRQERPLWLCAFGPFGWSLHLSSDSSLCPQLLKVHSQPPQTHCVAHTEDWESLAPGGPTRPSRARPNRVLQIS